MGGRAIERAELRRCGDAGETELGTAHAALVMLGSKDPSWQVTTCFRGSIAEAEEFSDAPHLQNSHACCGIPLHPPGLAPTGRAGWAETREARETVRARGVLTSREKETVISRGLLVLRIGIKWTRSSFRGSVCSGLKPRIRKVNYIASYFRNCFSGFRLAMLKRMLKFRTAQVDSWVIKRRKERKVMLMA